ncbi:MAG: sugar phosphate isomerase/epimerase [Victivallales bacterium]|nr:sugar phosphate isomerase/epimerase [Victivallales bacterium]
MKQLAMAMSPVSILADDFEDALRKSHLRAIEFSQGKVTSEEAVELELTKAAANKARSLHEAGLLQVPSIHLPFCPENPWSVTSLDEAERASSVQMIRRYLECMEGLDFHYITIHCGIECTSNDPAFRKSLRQQMKRTCLDLLPFLEKIQASLNLELLPRLCIGNHEDELLEIASDLPTQYINLNLDINHFMNRAAEVPNVIRKCASRIRAFHLSDYDSVDECHWQFGHGVLDWSAILDAINELPDNVLLIDETSALLPPAYRKISGNNTPTPLAVRFHSAEADFVRFLCAHEWDALVAKVFPN